MASKHKNSASSGKTATILNMVQKQTQTESASESTQVGELAQVQELLFGSQMRSQQEQTSALEENFDRKLLEKESALREEVVNLSNALRSERADRTAQVEQLQQTIEDLKSELTSQISSVANEEKANTAALERQLQETSTAAAINMDKAIECVDKKIAAHSDLIAKQNTDKHNLSELFGQLSRTLSKSEE